MKKRTTFFLLILTCTVGNNCRLHENQSPSDVFQSMADAYQKKTTKANEYAIQPQLAEQYIDYSDEIENMVTLDPLTSTTPERSSILSRLIDGKIRDFDYEIVSESVNGDDATLTGKERSTTWSVPYDGHERRRHRMGRIDDSQ